MIAEINLIRLVSRYAIVGRILVTELIILLEVGHVM